MNPPKPAKKPRKETRAPRDAAPEVAPARAAPEAAPTPSGAATSFPVVGIGASAGGIAAFEVFFAAMPQDEAPGMAFVVVQHLSPDHKSLLVDLVKRYTRMHVYEAREGMVVQPDCTYIIPPNHDLSLVDGVLHLEQHDAQRRPRLTVDHFFASLAKAQGERAIAIVMSGTGSDGTLGMREIKGEGGLVIAQAPDSTEYDGMPRSAIATGLVDLVLPPGEMPAQLIAFARHAFDPARKPAPSQERDGWLRKLCVLLRAQTGHDFSQYKETTLLRRMERRMALHQFEQPEDYLQHCRDNPAEVDALFRDLLIGVTSFFRDPAAFKALEEELIPRLLANKSAHEPLRVWVCGCSTGEEAYSLAILLHEQTMKSKRPFKMQIFATDIDQRAIEHARTGIYPASAVDSVSEERLSRFFIHDSQRGTYRIQKHVRDLVVFSEQDVIKDPPFSKLDLVSCRNLLIYLNAELQRKLIPLFHYALVPGGGLFLGTSETVGDGARLFSALDRKWKIYLRLPGERARPALPAFVPPLVDAGEHAAQGATGPHGEPEPANLRQVTERALLAHYAQAGVLVNARGEVLHIVGRTGKFLEPSAGDAVMNVLAMARDGLRRELTIALHKAVAHKQSMSYPGLKVKANGDDIRANLSVLPVDMGGGAVSYLVVLEEVAPRLPEVHSEHDADVSGRIAELERELRSKDEYLQTTLEEMETTNEELKSTNEEMQSVNEELSTVNAELQDKVAELSRANNDMNNLLAGTGVATVFVDHQLHIARFTPAATQVINFIPGDIGRPLEHVVSNLVGYDGMVEDTRTVLATLIPKEAEVQTKAGGWYLMRIRPYRTMENLIEGAVITLVDISERKKAEEALRRSEERLSILINQAYASVSEFDLDGRVLFANDRLCEMLGYTRDELLRRRLADITAPEDLAQVRAQYELAAGYGSDVQIDRRCVRADGGRVRALERVRVLRDQSGKASSLLVVSFDLPEGAERPPATDRAV